MDGISPWAEDHPEDAKLPRHQISRAFIPPCIHPGGGLTPPRVGLPLSDQPLAHASRNPRRTLLFSEFASYMPTSAGPCIGRNCLRNQGLRADVACRQRTVFEQDRGRLPENGNHTRESFCNSARSVRTSQVSRMRARI
jgi:hypothetical protein